MDVCFKDIAKCVLAHEVLQGAEVAVKPSVWKLG